MVHFLVLTYIHWEKPAMGSHTFCEKGKQNFETWLASVCTVLAAKYLSISFLTLYKMNKLILERHSLRVVNNKFIQLKPQNLLLMTNPDISSDLHHYPKSRHVFSHPLFGVLSLWPQTQPWSLLSPLIMLTCRYKQKLTVYPQHESVLVGLRKEDMNQRPLIQPRHLTLVDS